MIPKKPRLLLFIVIFLTISVYAQPVTISDTLISLKEFEVTDFMGEKVFQLADTIGMNSIRQVASRDIGDLLRSRPNISGVRKGGTGLDPVVRGFKFSQLNVQLNEGQKIEGACPNRMDPPTSHIDVNDIRKIELFKGPYALRFGPNFGGLIHLHTWPEKNADNFFVNVNASTGYESAWGGIKQNLAVKSGNKFFLLKVSGNYKKYGDYKDGNGNTVASSFERYNYSTVLTITPVKKHALTLFFEDATGKNLDFPALAMDERLDKTKLYSADYVYKSSGNILEGIHFKLYKSDVSHEMDNKQRPFSDTTVAIAIIDAKNSGYRAEASLKLADGTLHAGSDMEDIRKDGDRVKYMIIQPTLPIKNEKLWDNAHIVNYGFFAEYSKTFKKITAIAALRFDRNNAKSDLLSWENMQGQAVYIQEDVNSSFSNFSFSLGTDLHIRQNLKLMLSAGRGVRSPDMTERFIILLPIGNDNYDYIGNPALEPEKNYQSDASLHWTMGNAGMLKFSAFYSYVRDYITGKLVPESVVKPQTKGVYGVKQFINAEKAYFTGFELEYHTPLSHPWLLEAMLGYTYAVNPLATHYIIEDGQVVGSEEVKNDPLAEIPPFEGNVSFQWKLFDGKLLPRINIRAVAAQNRISRAYDERSTPGFVLANLAILYRFNSALQVTAGVDNLFNQAYYEHLNRNIVGSRSNFYEPGRNFFIILYFKL